MARVDVDLGTREYAIHIGSGVLQNLANAMQTLPTGRRLLLVTNPVVQKLFGKTLQDAFEGVGYEAVSYTHLTSERIFLICRKCIKISFSMHLAA